MNFPYTDYLTETVNGLRWYLTPAGALPSITTVLGVSESAEKKASLENWRISLGAQKADAHSQKARDHGTNVHLLTERFLKGEDVNALINGQPVPGADLAAFNALKFKLRKIKPWGIEKAVYSPMLEVAGRFDCVGEYNDIPSIIDFKTAGRIKHKEDIADYALQLTFYAIAHNELYDTDIRQGVILMSSAGGMPQEFTVDITTKLDELLVRIQKFWEKTLANVK